MSILSTEKGLCGSEVELVSRSEDCAVYRTAGDSGCGVMTSYRVFPGVELIYNDFHTGNCFQSALPGYDIMEINHCRQDRFECGFHDGSCAYLEKGDLAVNMMDHRTEKPCFPLEHYHGVSVVIELAEASRSISGVLSDISIDLYQLRDRLCPGNRCFIMRATDSVDELSVRFGIPLTAMKLCFKGVYGASVYSFMRAYRMQAAAALLCQDGESVSFVAGRVGYQNPSKFASAFKEVMGMSPLEYRKSNVKKPV
ncbi:MAG TPA: AraC family transcriptional regulator [Anaerovoracaceae bacterium]|nr:AraC family transcriptional regulator [Anaerovoracaceae bacterium]